MEFSTIINKLKPGKKKVKKSIEEEAVIHLKQLLKAINTLTSNKEDINSYFHIKKNRSGYQKTTDENTVFSVGRNRDVIDLLNHSLLAISVSRNKVFECREALKKAIESKNISSEVINQVTIPFNQIDSHLGEAKISYERAAKNIVELKNNLFRVRDYSVRMQRTKNYGVICDNIALGANRISVVEDCAENINKAIKALS